MRRALLCLGAAAAVLWDDGTQRAASREVQNDGRGTKPENASRCASAAALARAAEPRSPIEAGAPLAWLAQSSVLEQRPVLIEPPGRGRAD